MENTIDPRAEYEKRIKQRRNAAANRTAWHYRIGNARFVLFVIAAVIAWLGFISHELSPWWLVLPSCVFVGLMIWHGRVLAELQRFNRAIQFYERGFARLDEKWEGTGEPGERFADATHPYSEDLDLFGRGSLFELLCSARTHGGERMLASWLTAPAPPEEIRARQQSVVELRSNLDLREDLAVLGADVRSGIDPDTLIAWGSGEALLHSIWIRIVAVILAGISVAAVVHWGITGESVFFLRALLMEVVFLIFLWRKVRSVVTMAEKAGKNLSLLTSILSRLENEQFATPHLRILRAGLNNDGKPPSRLIAQLDRLIVLLDSSRNQLFAPIALILMWDVQLAYLVEAWRRKNGRFIAGWLATVAELEALSSLAGYSYEHPADPFPEIVDQPPCFEGEGLGHPLLQEEKCVRNDVDFSDKMQVLLVSGSNMSGKSTLLRTVGINTVLALAGATVRARRLRISPLSLGSSIRTMDSLHTGTSRFYAEITRLRQLVKIAEETAPLLFLLDELLHGTNSHDRKIGAEAIIKGLLRRGAVGLLTTHDLALASMAEELAPHAINVHFEDHIENGRMSFDYKLHPGVVKKSNALELMRSIGLEV
jgi:hypothetical protein